MTDSRFMSTVQIVRDPRCITPTWLCTSEYPASWTPFPEKARRLTVEQYLNLCERWPYLEDCILENPPESSKND
jgi:hypothetical protein